MVSVAVAGHHHHKIKNNSCLSCRTLSSSSSHRPFVRSTRYRFTGSVRVLVFLLYLIGLCTLLVVASQYLQQNYHNNPKTSYGVQSYPNSSQENSGVSNQTIPQAEATLTNQHEKNEMGNVPRTFPSKPQNEQSMDKPTTTTTTTTTTTATTTATTASTTTTIEKTNNHLVFSTSCSDVENWQSYLLFHQARIHQQPGTVTRIVSGCNEERQLELQDMFEVQIQPMAIPTVSSFYIHFTPDFGQPNLDWSKTKYWNKPFGIKHWMEHSLGYSSTSTSTFNKRDEQNPQKAWNRHDNDVVIILDADMILQRQILNDFTNIPMNVWKSYYYNHSDLLRPKVTHGHAIAQEYGFRERWLSIAKFNLTYILGTDSSPVYELFWKEQNQLFAVGPPYILTAKDAYQLVGAWTDILPRYFTIYPQFMAEMFSYSLAAAHLNIQHQVANGFMVSDVRVDTEGWDSVDRLSLQQTCSSGSHVVMTKSIKADSTIGNHPPLASTLVQQYYEPIVVHYCQSYGLGDFLFDKRQGAFHDEIFSCHAPLYELPPLNMAQRYNFTRSSNGQETMIQNETKRLRHAYMICAILSSMNQAALYFKERHCRTVAGNNVQIQSTTTTTAAATTSTYNWTVNYNMTWNYFTTIGTAYQQRKRLREKQEKKKLNRLSKKRKKENATLQ